jgi:hypothetical protein
VVYFIQAVDGGRIKIGTTIQLATRLKTLANECETDLRILAVMDGDRGVERAIHERFSGLRAVGEWFEPGDDLLGFIIQEGRAWDGDGDQPLYSLVSLKGSEDIEKWLDALVEHTHLGTRSLLIRNALRVYAESVKFIEPMPKR